MSNPGVPVLATVLCALGMMHSVWHTVPQVASPKRSDTSVGLEVTFITCGLGLYLWLLYRIFSIFPIWALNPHHPLVQGDALVNVSLEAGGLWLLWWGWWSKQPKIQRLKLSFPLLFGFFVLPLELWLRKGDQPLQRLGAELGAWIVLKLNQLSILWGEEVIELSFWNPYTFYSSDFYLIINETCSGVNLLVSSILYTFGFTWITGGKPKTALCLMIWTLPLSIFFNACRIAMIFLLGHYGGVELAMGAWHEGSAYLMQIPMVMIIAYLSPSNQGSIGAHRSEQGG